MLKVLATSLIIIAFSGASMALNANSVDWVESVPASCIEQYKDGNETALLICYLEHKTDFYIHVEKISATSTDIQQCIQGGGKTASDLAKCLKA